MLTEDYCSYEVSKLLKEKGFDIPCKYAWHGGIKEPDFHRHSRNFNGGDYKDLRTKWYSAPTHQMAMKWLRDVYNIHISVGKTFLINDMDDKTYLVRVCTKKYHTSYNTWSEYHSTYEEAVEAALKYCLADSFFEDFEENEDSIECV